METKKLGFGLMRMPLLDPENQKSIDYDQVKQMVDTFISRGFTYFDTAYMYHEYVSETVLRDCVVGRHPRQSFTVATKMPIVFVKKEEDLERIFQEQLEKTGAGYFDYYLLHNLNTANYETAERVRAFAFIQKKKEEGVIKNIGFSFHDTAEVLDKILTEHPEVDFVQLQINYLDWDDPKVQSGACCETAVRHGKKVIVMEPVKGGKLAQVPEAARAVFEKYQPNMSPASWAIRFAAGQENVMMVLSGMSSMEQLLDNTGYMTEFCPLNTQEKAALEEALKIIKESIPIPCTACRYCVEGCPKKIAIPEYFTLYNETKQASEEKVSEKKMEYAALTGEHGKASDCVQCRKCEKSCPQHLTIVEYLKRVAAKLEK